MLFILFVVLLTCGKSSAECGNTQLEDQFGSIKYFPANRERGESSTKNCRWQIATPTNGSFILVVNVDYLQEYQDNDVITLPDGNVYEGDEISTADPATCFKYKPQGTALNTECLEDLEDSYCSTIPSKALVQPAAVSISTGQNGNQFTDLLFSYFVVVCLTPEMPTTTTASPSTVNIVTSSSASNNSKIVQTEASAGNRGGTEPADSSSTAIVAAVLSVLLLVCGVIIVLLVIKLRHKDNTFETKKQNPNVSSHTPHTTNTPHREDQERGIYVEPNTMTNSSPTPNVMKNNAKSNHQFYSMATNNVEESTYNHLDESPVCEINEYEMANGELRTGPENVYYGLDE